MAKANSKHREAFHQLSDIGNDIGERLRIARSVRQPYAVRVQGDYLIRGGVSGYDCYPPPQGSHAAKAVMLETEVVCDNVKASLEFTVRQPVRRRMQLTRRSICLGL